MNASSATSASGRGWVAVQFFLMSAVLLAAAWPGLRWSGSGSLWAGIPMFVLGAWIGLKGKADLGRNRITRPTPRPDGELVTGGIYALIRQPLHALLILLGFAWALFWRCELGGIGGLRAAGEAFRAGTLLTLPAGFPCRSGLLRLPP
jgi:protein-S-isoprenylcysteine O-methyltransferase Ste14